MGWPSDLHGMAFKPKEVKLYRGGSWGMRLSQLSRQQGKVYIATYSLPVMSYIDEQFNRRPHDIQLICHGRFIDRAREIRKKFPKIEVRVHPKTHGKLLLISPETVYVGSANFGDSGWKEFTVGIRGFEAFDYYLEAFIELFNDGIKV